MKLYEQYHKALFEEVLPFWCKFSLDFENGGYFTCLDQFGRVYDTDKFIWPQARQVWLFSMLYNNYEKNKKWLDVARHGYGFLSNYGMDKKGDWYFAVDRQGKPLTQPYNIFSDCFGAIYRVYKILKKINF